MSMRPPPLRLVPTLAIVLVTISAVLLDGSQPAGASCLSPLSVADAIAQSDIVVVGTVTSARSRDRVATVRVEERWKGAVANTFEVFGGPATDDTVTSVDRTYEVGLRYLLFAREPAAHDNPAVFGGRYEDNACSTTQPWSGVLTPYRPANAKVVGEKSGGVPKSEARSPAQRATRSTPTAEWRWAVVALAGCAPLFAVVLIARRHRRSTSSPAAGA